MALPFEAESCRQLIRLYYRLRHHGIARISFGDNFFVGRAWGCIPSRKMQLSFEVLIIFFFVFLRMKKKFGKCKGGCLSSEVINVYNSELISHQSYYVHFWANTLTKMMKPPYATSYEINSTTSLFQQGWLWY